MGLHPERWTVQRSVWGSSRPPTGTVALGCGDFQAMQQKTRVRQIHQSVPHLKPWRPVGVLAHCVRLGRRNGGNYDTHGRAADRA